MMRALFILVGTVADCSDRFIKLLKTSIWVCTFQFAYFITSLIIYIYNIHIQVYIYTIIRLKSVSQATFADCRSQFLLDRLGRCLKLIVSYRGTSSHEFASQFGLAFFLYVKNIYKLSRMPTVAELSVE